MAPTIGAVLRQAREVRQLSAGDTARAASISPAYLNRLENDAVKRPSPHVLHQLSEALAVPYAELLSLSGYRLPDEPERDVSQSIGANAAAGVTSALFADLTDDEREELLEYLAWYRARKRSKRSYNGQS